MGILQDFEKGDLGAVWSDIVKSWEGSSVGNAIDNAAAAAWAELKTVGPSDLLSIVENVGTSILTGLASGNATSAIIAEGINIAEQAFKNASVQVANTTLTTFVSAIHNQVSTQETPAAPAPTAESPATPPATAS